MGITDLPLVEALESPPAEAVYADAEARLDTELGHRAAWVLDRLAAEHPPPYCFLDAADPFQLLIAVILSAQCTDEQVNRTTPQLFERFPTPEAMAEADREEIEELIYSTGFYRSKARYIQGTARKLVAEFDGEVPRTLEELVTLPGVARKTATVVLWYAYARVEGITVDTHVLRLAKRLGLTDARGPARVERDLMELVPQARWPDVTYHLITHGREVCDARKPRCRDCVLAARCPSAFEFGDEG